MKRWKEEEGKGYIFILEMFFFIMERLGRGRGNLMFQNHYGTEERVHQEKTCRLIFFLLFLLLRGRGVEVNVFFFAYTYDLATTPVRTQAGGCLTTKKGA
jgi:hypothetical protein